VSLSFFLSFFLFILGWILSFYTWLNSIFDFLRCIFFFWILSRKFEWLLLIKSQLGFFLLSLVLPFKNCIFHLWAVFHSINLILILLLIFLFCFPWISMIDWWVTWGFESKRYISISAIWLNKTWWPGEGNICSFISLNFHLFFFCSPLKSVLSS